MSDCVFFRPQNIVYLNVQLYFYVRKNISHTIVYDDPKHGILLHHSNRGRPEKMKTSVSLKRPVAQLRKDLKFDKGSKLLLILSFSTDLMIKEMMKYPEVTFHDVTSCANKEKRDLFVTVGRKPSGKCFISNITLIPSGT